jgi:hypothetical protein
MFTGDESVDQIVDEKLELSGAVRWASSKDSDLTIDFPLSSKPVTTRRTCPGILLAPNMALKVGVSCDLGFVESLCI